MSFVFEDIGNLSYIKRVTLDLSSGPSHLQIYAKQNDENSRYVEVTIIRNGEVFTIPDSAVARLRAKKPNGKIVYAECAIHNNKVYADLSKVINTAGAAIADVELTVIGQILSTQSFVVSTCKAPFEDSDVEDSDDFSALKEALLLVAYLDENGKVIIPEKYIKTAMLDTAAVTTPKIDDKAVTNPLIADDAVDGRTVAECSITNDHLLSTYWEKVEMPNIDSYSSLDNLLDEATEGYLAGIVPKNTIYQLSFSSEFPKVGLLGKGDYIGIPFARSEYISESDYDVNGLFLISLDNGNAFNYLRGGTLTDLSESKGAQKFVSLSFNTYYKLRTYDFKKNTKYFVELIYSPSTLDLSYCGYFDAYINDNGNLVLISLSENGYYIVDLSESSTNKAFVWFSTLDQTYNPDSKSAQSGVAVAEAIKGNPNCHAKYFDITDDGEITIKTDSAESIPADLIIPEVVNEIAVDRLSSKMLYGNTRVESVTFPDTIEVIPDECFNTAVNLKRLNNTEHIKKIGAKAFRWTRIEKAVFPNLEVITGVLAFSTIPHLAYADVGKVTEIPAQTFKHCNYLSKVVGMNVTTVGKEAFNNTVRLVNVDFIKQLTSIGDHGFWLTNFDKWDDLQSTATLGTNATTQKANPTDFWSNIEFTPCKNPTPTAFCQRDDRWINRQYGGVIPGTNKVTTYADGCLQMCATHLYSGLNNLPFESVTDFEDVVKGIESVTIDGTSYTGTELLEMQDTTPEKNVIMLRGLGLTCVENTEWNAENLTALYNTLKNGGYAIATVNVSGAHAVLVYGVTEKGELLVLDSERRYPYDSSKPSRYKLPIQKILLSSSDCVLVTEVP